MIENKFLEVGYLKEYTSRTYDDDPIPYKLLREFNLENYIPKDLVYHVIFTIIYYWRTNSIHKSC